MNTLYDQDLVDELRKRCDSIEKRLWICSPYIGKIDPIYQIIGDKWNRYNKIDFRLLVDYSNPNNFNYETLEHLLNLNKKNFRLKSLVALHAKIYIFDNECLVTSANLSPTAFECRSIHSPFQSNFNCGFILIYLKLIYGKKRIEKKCAELCRFRDFC